MIRTISTAIAVSAIALTVAAFRGTSSGGAPGSQGATVLDVRSPDEVASGKLAGAHVLDFNSGEFAASLAQLDPAVDYAVYCRSGGRAGMAIEMMQRAGFTGELTNLGSLEQAASATGVDIVTG